MKLNFSGMHTKIDPVVLMNVRSEHSQEERRKGSRESQCQKAADGSRKMRTEGVDVPWSEVSSTSGGILGTEGKIPELET